MRRRDFISLIGSAGVWPVAAWAQQGKQVRRVAVLMSLSADDPEATVRSTVLAQTLQELGWTVGQNIQLEYRWAGGDAGLRRRYAADLVALAPDVILTNGAASLIALRQETGTLPIVFINIVDPVGAGFVASLARPGGNITGFTLFEFGLSGKWLELLKEIKPSVTRVAIIRDGAATVGIGQWAAIQSAASSFGLELAPIDPRDAGEIERAITAFAQFPNGGLIVTVSTLAALHRELIGTVADRYHLPAVYGLRYFVASGGLLSYGPDTITPMRRAAGYVDRILKGEKPADLPVQAPTKYELVVNLKTAKALGLTVPDTLLARADEVIE